MTQRASVTLKIATSLDGRIALSNGVSQWITGEKSRERVHEMRAQHDAVLVGVGTVLADDPLLTARTVPLPSVQPTRIVADSRLRTPSDSRLCQSVGAGRVVLAHAGTTPERQQQYDNSIEFWNAGNASGRVSPVELLRRARAESMNSIFLEGGGQLAAGFINEQMIDRIEWFRAPIILGGDGIPAIGGLGLEVIAHAGRWSLEQSERIGEDILETWVIG
ncbi:RibD family protein [Henriciella sp.]|uniref:RibD family protein n=1 Tax=Henriciella sp. TaxID=1968823 RepID=UPI00263A0265|nr:RibD family protein [Henriciella sp.]